MIIVAHSIRKKKLFFAWLKINELRNIVAAKRILIQRRKHKLRLSRVLNPQVHFLNQWEPLAKRHIESITGLSKVLEAVCIPIPLVDGAQTNLVLLHSYFSMSMEIMVEIEAAVRLFYSKVEEVSTILAQLAETVGLEMEGIEELIKTSKKITKLEMHETSLRANLIQAVKKEVEPTPLSTLRLQSWTQSHQWPIY
ncbi:uncharacterized protein A4U43_C04F35200 [Asparagus officinalis]|uniref:QWRF motif-containing protein 7 n=1 Tax=Asparagus officinalis TaxID=4686 RepID=A0A5P1FAV8_ASPOF|nr:uncharacterized protein A4U43_C04F35200 [Asparagus officinalis]